MSVTGISNPAAAVIARAGVDFAQKSQQGQTTQTAQPGATATETAAQLAKETVQQLQKKAQKGDRAAVRELARREKQKALPQGKAARPESSGAAETSRPTQEPGKGTELDKTA